MLSTLVSHNEDIRRLVEKGYAISVDNNYLVVRDIPYLDENKTLRYGAFVTKMVVIDQIHVQIEDHQVFFCGAHPCQLDGRPIGNLGGGPTTLALNSPDLKVERSFSNKPPNGFPDFFEKIESYTNIIGGPAMSVYNVTQLTFRTQEEQANSVFKIRDSLTSRAEIGDLNTVFKDDIIAIIGLGGTGSYVLDFLAKTPVKEIRGFDGDWFHAHNAFRSPGWYGIENLGKKKAEVYGSIYESFREGLIIKTQYIQADSIEDMEGVTFAFVCVDKGEARSGIIQLLNRMNIPYLDVGMGLDRDKGPISGILRTTYVETGNAEKILEKKWIPLTDPPDDIYHNNIQIGELNALNACLAVIRFKKLRGFYNDDAPFSQLLFTLDNLTNLTEP